MSSDDIEPTPEILDYIKRRIEQAEINNGFDLQIDLRWISAIRSLVTAHNLTQRFVGRFLCYKVVAESLENKSLIDEVQITINNTVSFIKRFEDKAYNRMDLSPANVAVCNNALQSLIPDLSRLTDEDIINCILKEAQELQTRVSVNGMLQGKKTPGLMSLFNPKYEMRPDVIRLIENLAAVKTAIIDPASRILKSEASKN